jgi:hypothetical protein
LTFVAEAARWSLLRGLSVTQQIWRLSEYTPDSLGLACTDDGLLRGHTLLIERRGGRIVSTMKLIELIGDFDTLDGEGVFALRSRGLKIQRRLWVDDRSQVLWLPRLNVSV